MRFNKGANYATSYSYDALGNLTLVTQGGQTRTFTYDSLSRLRQAKNPEQVNGSGTQVATVYDYDEASNLRTKTNPNGSSVSLLYDGLNRVKQKTLSNGPVFLYTYDGAGNKGRLMAVVKQGSTDGYYDDSYDAVGKLLTCRQITDGVTYPMSYGYDLMGNLTTETYPSGRVVTTSYDAAGRLSTVSGQQSGGANKTYASGYSYTAAGTVAAMQMSNGAMSEQTLYNSRLQPTQMEWRKVAGNVVILGLDYSYGVTGQNNGNLASQGIRVGTSTIATQTYSYDHLNRLSTVSESNPVASWQQTYFYDRFGNRAVSSTSSYIPTPRQTPTANTINDLASVISPTSNRIIATSDYHYDTSGNLDKQPNVAAGFDQMSYDAENRQVSYTKGGVTSSYSYDGEGRRVKKVDSGGTTVYVYDGMGHLVAEYHSDPVPPVALASRPTSSRNAAVP